MNLYALTPKQIDADSYLADTIGTPDVTYHVVADTDLAAANYAQIDRRVYDIDLIQDDLPANTAPGVLVVID